VAIVKTKIVKPGLLESINMPDCSSFMTQIFQTICTQTVLKILTQARQRISFQFHFKAPAFSRPRAAGKFGAAGLANQFIGNGLNCVFGGTGNH
jgi:hypothetical protein